MVPIMIMMGMISKLLQSVSWAVSRKNRINVSVLGKLKGRNRSPPSTVPGAQEVLSHHQCLLPRLPPSLCPGEKEWNLGGRDRKTDLGPF